MKVWDLGGQVQYRTEWGRYIQGTQAIVYVQDGSNESQIPIAKRELHNLLDDTFLHNIPILVVGNKIDLAGHLSEKDIIEGLNQDYVYSNHWAVLQASAKVGTNINAVLEWLVKTARANPAS